MVVFSPCVDCKHLSANKDKMGQFVCPAFPEGIPKEVFWDSEGKLCETQNKNSVHFEPVNNH